MSWDRAQGFAEWLSNATSKRYRLLSEAEWEYCCRAGSETDYSTGETISLHQACYASNRTEEVSRYEPNEFGLSDMHGNVWEWCKDLWHSDYFGAPTDGSAWLACGEQSRLVRGGSWQEVDDEEHETPSYLRSAVRYPYAPATRRTTIGFRVAREL
ncbi:MAG: formylglycine-generating enzyme family protein [Alphaproteobacteria bacterium]|nr:formylglycine-generating enzyme family protein [Alphaproteobacteria bacterium]